MITCCSGFASIQFLVSGDGKRLHPRTSKSFLQFSALLLQSVKMGTIWRSLKGSVNFQLISSSSSLAMVALSYFLGSFHRPIPVRYNWNAFARKMHSTSQFAMIVLSTSVCVSTAVSTGMQSFILGRCTIVIVQGMDRTYEAPSNEAPHMILGYHQGRLLAYRQLILNFSTVFPHGLCSCHLQRVPD